MEYNLNHEIKSSSSIFINMVKCLICNKDNDGKFGSGKYCSSSCANTRKHSTETKNKISGSLVGKPTWNKGKKVKWEYSTCQLCKKELVFRRSSPKKFHPDCWLKSSGGYRKGSGIGKSGWYKGYWCDSSYELAWVIYQLDHNIPFERNKKKYKYTWKNKDFYYIPDFIQNNKLVEIKGFCNSQTKEKLNSIKDIDLIVLYKKDLTKEFEYVELKYGKNFITLYEKS